MTSLARLFGNGRRRLLASAAAVLLIAATAALVVGFSAQHHAPQPPASAAVPIASTSAPSATEVPAPPSPSAPPSSATPAAPAPTTPAATPVALSIPAIGVHHSLLKLGQNSDGTVEVPPMSDVASPGWYRYSPAPGQIGPAVIVGHIDSTTGAKGVFYGLGALRRGDTVEVGRSDGTVAVFKVDGVDSYPKNAFPTATVYGNTTNPQLRLITCGGPFEHNEYLNDIVVFATMTGSHR